MHESKVGNELELAQLYSESYIFIYSHAMHTGQKLSHGKDGTHECHSHFVDIAS